MAKKEIDTRFNKFGTVSFTSTTKVNDFIDRLEQGKVSGTRCKKCGMTFFPPRADCYQCFSSDMEWFDVAGTGKLVTYSKLEYAPVGFDGDLPYAIALLDFGDFKVFGRLDSNLSDDEIQVGMEMKTAVNKLPNGQLNYVFQKA
ncbi:MAG: Zn-ribbon domain-containing OB-fold protein [Deltaproteobacteria bacterium]|nr:Zn-ribbon domain-containing OB-fold protein [Deltaproteobacteria bacterium]